MDLLPSKNAIRIDVDLDHLATLADSNYAKTLPFDTVELK
jgi:hypothetical protein